ncbi:SH3 domain-containing protein [Terrilactibacillus laevilacticus]|uniref:SH3 domain-containing protein n=1 Tax=Terrilactibacillus laevilacticus TaxID=1380157 RepID=A0ABW5PV64_9BACI|nr:SH3 domain-containing protein [Terrilactibacillus laevilacticus]
MKKYVKIITISIAILLFFNIVLPSISLAATAYTAIENLNVRSTPSTNKKSIGLAKKGTKLTVTGTSGSWYKIKYNHKSAYVYAKYVKKTNTSTPVLINIKYDGYGANSVYIRATPNGKHLTTWSKNTPISVVGQIGNWLKIKYNNGYAYTYKTHVKKGKPAPLYKAYGKDAVDVIDKSNGKKLTTWPEGTSFNVYAQNGDWMVINYGSGYAYTNKGHVTKTAPSVKVLDKGVTTDKLNVRSAPSKHAVIFTIFSKDKQVEIVGSTGSWLKIKYNSGYAYVSAAYVTKQSTNKPKPISKPDPIEKKVVYQVSPYDLKTAITNQVGRAQTYYDKSKFSFYIIKNALTYDAKSMKWMANDTWNVRSGPGINYPVLTTLVTSKKVDIDSQINGWYKLKNFHPTTINASYEEIEKYLNPNNYSTNDFQFLKLSSPSYASSSEINEKILKGKGILEGKADSFIKAAELYHINELYLIAHTLHETGQGTSDLATGKLKIDPNTGQLSTNDSGISVYNMYGIGAYDGQSEKTGAEYAYKIDSKIGKERWDTPEKAIINGAKWIADGYINAGQDTLYKMRWDPNPTKSYSHQYATDIAWAVKQTPKIKSMYDLLSNYSITFEIPKYK